MFYIYVVFIGMLFVGLSLNVSIGVLLGMFMMLGSSIFIVKVIDSSIGIGVLYSGICSYMIMVG